MPIFGPMEFENSQLQSFFLEKLRDPLEDEGLKLAIIDLISVSIDYQPGLTAAFFNLKPVYDDPIQSGESIGQFMLDYLQNMEKVF